MVSSEQLIVKKQSKSKQRFEDPARKLWVWLVFLVLLAAMPPVWPVSGIIFGIPTWVIGAVVISLASSGVICYVIFKVWHDPEDKSPPKIRPVL